MLSPDDVHNAEFGRSWRRSRSYDEGQVDEFLDRVDATLSGKDTVTAHEVLSVRFSPRKPGKRAYKKSQVDAFLDKVALTLLKREVQRAEEREQPPGGSSGAEAARGPRAESARERAGGSARADAADRRGSASSGSPAAQPGPGERPGAAARGGPAQRGPAVRPGRAARPAAGAQRKSAVRPEPAADPVPDVRVATRAEPAAPAHPAPAVRPAPTARPESAARAAPPAPAARLEAAGRAPRAASGSAGDPVPAAVPARADNAVPVRRPRPASDSETHQQSALDMAEVDAFMDRVEATLRGEDALTAQEVLHARFSAPAPGQAGYQEDSVVAFLAMVSRSIQHLAPRERPVPQQRMPIARAFRRGERANFPELTPDVVRHVVLSTTAPNANGYHEDDVDDFLDRVEETLRGDDALRSGEVSAVRFRELPLGHGGYDREEVEVLLGIIEDRLDTDAARRA